MKACTLGAALLLGIAGWTAGLAPAAAQPDYPNRALTMIVPFPAGGRTDVVGRIV